MEENTKDLKTPPVLRHENDGIFKRYCLWKSLPSFLKSPPPNKDGSRPTPEQFADQLGIDDMEIRELALIRWQKDFAIKYGLTDQTLSDWNKKYNDLDPFEQVRNWSKHLTKNVVTAMYNNALSSRNLNADRDRLNFLKFHGFRDGMDVALHGEGLFEILKRGLDDGKKLPANIEIHDVEKTETQDSLPPRESPENA